MINKKKTFLKTLRKIKLHILKMNQLKQTSKEYLNKKSTFRMVQMIIYKKKIHLMRKKNSFLRMMNWRKAKKNSDKYLLRPKNLMMNFSKPITC